VTVKTPLAEARLWLPAPARGRDRSPDHPGLTCKLLRSKARRPQQFDFFIDDDHLVADHEVAVAAHCTRVGGTAMTRTVLGTAVPTLMEKLTLLARGPVSLILVRCSVVSVAPLPPVCPC
jgi:hypothetical protein